MSDLRTRLEQIGDRARPAANAFERLERVRRRRERNRRVGAGVVALAVAVAGSFALFSSFRPGGDGVAGGNDDFFALWPDSTLEEALAAQGDVDNGDPDDQWRLDAEATAIRFVDHALGWADDPDNLAVASTASADGLTTVELQTPPSPCPSPPVPACAGRDVTVRLRQLVAEGGIWNVVSVESGVFNMPVRPGDTVQTGSELTIAAGFQSGTEIAVGVAGTGSCSGFHEETALVEDLQVSVSVDGIRAGCNGYVYALTPPTPIGQVELGRIMFVLHEPRPALEYMIHSITAVPVTFVSADDGSADAADVARIACHGLDPVVDTPIVRTHPDGVHVRLSNPTDEFLSFSILSGPVGDEITASGLEPGLTELVLTVPPGRVRFSCSSAPEEAQEATAGTAEFEVVDPDGNYVSAELQCDGGLGYGSAAGYPAATMGDQGEPLEIAQRRLTGLEPDDVFERAGYGGAPFPILRIVRHGTIVGKVTLADDEQGGWLLNSIEGCGGTSFGWDESSVESAPRPRGFFEWCPEPPFLDAPGDWRQQASDVAVRFAGAYEAGEEAALAQVLDPSVPADAEFGVSLAEGAEPTVIGTNVRGGGIVDYSCGNDVDAYTVTVTIEDGSTSASADFIVFLILREDGWKVWGVY